MGTTKDHHRGSKGNSHSGRRGSGGCCRSGRRGSGSSAICGSNTSCGIKGGVLKATCLKPNYSLRYQLLLSFGSSAFISSALVIILAIIACLTASERVKHRSDLLLKEQVILNTVASARFVADRFAGYLDNLRGSTQLMVELVQDRIVGYENGEISVNRTDGTNGTTTITGWIDDTYVPFYDTQSNRNVYPLRATDPGGIPIDWNITVNVNAANAAEHLQERAPWLEAFPSITTATASWFMQGSCDPNATDSSQAGYYENCGDGVANNGFSTGGVVAPTSVAGPLHDKASDIAILLKPLMEAQAEALLAGFHFVNDGAGAYVHFPGNVHPGVAYTSLGCDYLATTINPYTGKPYLSRDLVERNCHAAGTQVHPREYNSLERPWFRQAILDNNDGSSSSSDDNNTNSHDPNKVHIIGPVLTPGAKIATLTISKPAYSHVSGELIGCAVIDIAASDLNNELEQSRLHHGVSELAIVRVADDSVVADTLHSLSRQPPEPVTSTEHAPDSATHTQKGGEARRTAHQGEPAAVYISETPMMIENDTYEKLKSTVVDLFQGEWTPEHVQMVLSQNFNLCEKGIQTIYPVPPPPDTYDATYQPDMLVVYTVDPDIFDGVAEINSTINDDVLKLIATSIAIGLVGFVTVLIVVVIVSRVLTKPLLWMERVAWRIVNHTDKRMQGASLMRVSDNTKENSSNASHDNGGVGAGGVSGASGLLSQKDEGNSSVAGSGGGGSDNDNGVAVAVAADGNDGTRGDDHDESEFNKCTPKTEITELVSEFRTMIQGFSGDGPSRVADAKIHELRNELTWQRDYQRLFVVPEQQALADEVEESEPHQNQPPLQPQSLSVPEHIGNTGNGTSTAVAPLSRPLHSNAEAGDFPSAPSASQPPPAIASTFADPAATDTPQPPHGSTPDKTVPAGTGASSIADLSSDVDTTSGYLCPQNGKLDQPDACAQASGDENDCSNRVEGARPTELSAMLRTHSYNSLNGNTVQMQAIELARCDSSIRDPTELDTEASQIPIIPSLPKKNLGSNVVLFPQDEASSTAGGLSAGLLNDDGYCPRQQARRACRSSLFWWIVVCIVIPLLLSNAIIVYIVGANIADVIPSWVRMAEDYSFELEREALATTTALKAKLAQTLIFEPVRDLHLMTRLAGLLFFGGIQTSGSFTMVDQAAEECKAFSPEDDSCPIFATERAVCLCEWNDQFATQACTVPNNSYSRPLQQRFYAVQARDGESGTGDRVAAESFPEFDYSPNTTLWYNGTQQLPGAWKSSDAAGFETAYDRIRVSSAMGVFELPVYNYPLGLGRAQKFDLGTLLAFDADGGVAGFKGCDKLADYAHFESTEENRAAILAPELCPEGKFGYDARCRDWYHSGKEKYLTGREPVHITPPYAFAVNNLLAATATSPIANPKTNEYVGQMLLDFFPAKVLSSLDRLREEVSVLITPEEDATGGDTVVGPNKTAGWKSASVTDLLLPYDDADSSNRAYFETNVLAAMKNGSSDISVFTRKRSDGIEDTLLMAYEPVYLRALLPLDPSDVSRGVNYTYKVAYSVGIGRNTASMKAPFDRIESDVDSDLDQINAIYISLVVVISVLFTIFTAKVTVKVTNPMIALLDVVKNINSGRFEDDIPPLQGGSREVNQVYNSFAKLYKIVKISNGAYFSGNLKWAYHFVNDALMLFRKINDRKAIGIASNNLANTLHAMRHEGQPDENMCTPTAALDLYNDAIAIAEQDLADAGSEDDKAEFAQQLSDRVFNRGLYLMMAHRDEGAPENAIDMGYSDIERTRQLDYDIQDFWLDRRLLLKHSAAVFVQKLRRVHGLLEYYDDDTLRQIWDARDLIGEADQLLFAAWDQPTAPLFYDITRMGRLQQLESALIRLELVCNNNAEAGRFAMRVFTEDEYIMESLFKNAATAVLRLLNDGQPVPWASDVASSTRADLRTMVSTCKNFSLDLGKRVVFSFEISERWELDPLHEKICSNCRKIYDECINPSDLFGLVANTSDGDLRVPLRTKRENLQNQIQMLTTAITSTRERNDAPSCFPYTAQMLLDSTDDSLDSFVLHITDGCSSDAGTWDAMKRQIEHWNSERHTKLHIIVVGLGLQGTDVALRCQDLCSVTDDSFYVDVTMNNIDTVFESISALMKKNRNHDSNIVVQGLTMEKF